MQTASTTKSSRTIKERRQFDNKKPEELELKFDNFDVAIILWILWIWILCTIT